MTTLPGFLANSGRGNAGRLGVVVHFGQDSGNVQSVIHAANVGVIFLPVKPYLLLTREKRHTRVAATEGDTDMQTLYRIGVIGTKGGRRQYVGGTAHEIDMCNRADALHWNKREATILCDAFNAEFARKGRTERFQIERNA